MTQDKNKTKAQLIDELVELRKRLVEQASGSENEFTDVALDAQLDTFFLFEPATGKAVHWNRSFRNISGYSDEEIASMPAPDTYYSPEDLKRAGTFTQRILEEGAGTIELELVCKNGCKVPTEYRVSVITGEQGEPKYIISVGRDITKRKQAEEALRESEHNLSEAQALAHVGHWRMNVETQEVVGSAELFRIFGVSEEDATLETFAGVVHPDDRERDLSLIRRGMEHGEPWKLEHRVISGDGIEKTVYARGEARLDGSGKVVELIGTVQDITERKRVEQERLDFAAQLQHAQKLESLGVLAGGIAHDFNNLLMGVLGNADLALANLSPVSPATVSIEKVQQAATRAAELANQMLAYSGKGQFVVKVVSLSEVVQEMGHLLSASVSKATNLKYHLDEKILPIEADVTQIRQVVMNLITNASESLHDESGIVRLSTGVMVCKEADQSEGFVIGECAEGTYVFLDVSDTGVGMDEETVSKIFDPFFTTKFAGRGLGLAAVFGIVRGHNGATKIESELGKGTTIRVLFPVTEKPAESIGDSGEAGAIPTDGGTILLVDDEPIVLDVGARMLGKAGYEVKTARDGVEAVEVFKEYSHNIDCVILDLTLPRMNGEQTFVELQTINNDVRVLLSSGYSAGEVEARISAKGFAGFIQKPYRLNELKKSLREVLSK